MLDNLYTLAIMRNKQAGIGFIFVTLLLDVTGLGIIIPVLPKLIADLRGIPINEASESGGLLIASFAIAQFLFSPILGNLSDRYGRRPVLLFSMFGFSIDYLIMAFAPTYAWLVIGRILSGITGASFTTASAYIADISDDSNRAKNFGMIGAAFGAGFVLGPVIGGFCAEFGERTPFFLASALCLLNFFYGYFVLPESLKQENRRAFDWKKANPVSTFKTLIHYKSIAGLLVAYTLIFLGGHAVQSNWNYYTIYRFNWSPKEVGISLAAVGVLVGAIQGGLTKFTSKWLGNERSVYVGLSLYTIGMILFASATQSWMMYAYLIPYCLGGICGPSLQALMSKGVPPTHQGALQGGLTSLMSITSIFGPMLMTGLFTYYTKKESNHPIIPGAPFYAGAILVCAAAIITWWDLHWKKRNGN